MRKTKILNQAGDTIVEVLLAVVVVGLAVGLGYGVASRSLKSNQQAQERVEALKQVESQVERLKKLALDGTGGPNTVFRTESFCIVDNGSGANQVVTITTPPALDADNLDPANYSGCEDGTYFISITPGTGADANQFNVKARWFSIGNSGKEEVNVTYRIYPGT